jgi:uncharacterized damage-inducible protein DinB
LTDRSKKYILSPDGETTLANTEENAMSLIQPLLAELEQEKSATIRLLQAVPADKLSWKPHEKSMSLGQLAQHIATTPGPVAEMMDVDEFEMTSFDFPEAESADALVPTFETSAAKATEVAGQWDDTKALGAWSVKSGDKVLMEASRIAALRMIMLNHLYHHRGQLTVYLRMLDVPLPSVYGPTADENRFAA